MTLYPIKILGIIDETDNVRSYVLESDHKFFTKLQYQPGQFVTLHLPQFDDDTNKTLPAYISSIPSNNTLKITIKRENTDSAAYWVYSHLKAGDHLETSLPKGGFGINSSINLLSLLVDCTGIIPAMTLLEQELQKGQRSIKLFYDCNSYNTIVFREEINLLRKTFPQRFECIYHLDLKSDELHADTLKFFVKNSDIADFLLCGLDEHNHLCKRVLTNLGVSHNDIYIENCSLLNNQKGSSQKTRDPGFSPKKIIEFRATLDGKEHRVKYQKGKTLLECMLSAGLDPYYSCSDAHCGYCMAIKKSGQLTMKKTNVLSNRDIERGYVLLCQAVPLSEDVWVDCDA